MAQRNDIKVPASVEGLRDTAVKGQLRVIATRVRDLVSADIGAARAAVDEPARLRHVLAAHTAAMHIFESESAGYFHNVPGGPELKHSFACTAGCNFCCHLHVDITALEAVAMTAALAEAQRQAVAEMAPRVRGLSVDARRAARLPCALLAAGVCSVYEARPTACRALYSTDARACEQVLLAPLGTKLPPIRSPAVPRALADSVAAGINTALLDHGLQAGLFELTGALDALVSDPDATTRWLAGERVFPAKR